MRFWFEGGAGRVPAGHEHAVGRQPGYEGGEIVRVLARWFWEFGDWPTEWEYQEWRSLQLLAWRRAGLSGRRLPGMKQIRTAYRQGFAGAVNAAQRWVDRGGG
jgi:hypothetical protein